MPHTVLVLVTNTRDHTLVMDDLEHEGIMAEVALVSFYPGDIEDFVLPETRQLLVLSMIYDDKRETLKFVRKMKAKNSLLVVWLYHDEQLRLPESLIHGQISKKPLLLGSGVRSFLSEPTE